LIRNLFFEDFLVMDWLFSLVVPFAAAGVGTADVIPAVVVEEEKDDRGAERFSLDRCKLSIPLVAVGLGPRSTIAGGEEPAGGISAAGDGLLTDKG
jgi:hypothetical protein